MNIAKELKPCPFCGELEHLYPGRRALGAGPIYQIDCVGCGIEFTPREGMDVIAAWNRRSPASAIEDREELVKALRGALTVIDLLPVPDDVGSEVRKAVGNRREAAAALLSRIGERQS